MAMKYAVQPIYTDDAGNLCFCPGCYPMLQAPEQLHNEHYRRDFGNSLRVTVHEGSEQLEQVAELIRLHDIPGALVYEFVREPDGRYELCYRNGHTEIMLRLRYSPDIEIRHDANP